MLTGQAVHRLENGGNLWSLLPKKFACYPDMLEAEGYAVGHTGKGWGPGTLEGSGRTRNPAGPRFRDFETFLAGVPSGKPFCYWYGSVDPHRPYEKGSGARSGMDPKAVTVPSAFPDTPEVRSDILDYYFEVERFDRAVGAILKTLDDRGTGGRHAAGCHQRQRHALPARQGEPVRPGDAHAAGDPLAPAAAQGRQRSTPS